MATKRLIVAAAAIAATGLAIAPALADSQPYTGVGVVASCAGTPLVATGVSQVDQVLTPSQSVGVGGDCFAVPAGNSGLTVTVTDTTGQQVGFNVQYQAADGATNSAQIDAGCGTGTFTFPTDITTQYVYVFTDDPASSSLDCATPDVATTGNIDVEWTPATTA